MTAKRRGLAALAAPLAALALLAAGCDGNGEAGDEGGGDATAGDGAAPAASAEGIPEVVEEVGPSVVSIQVEAARGTGEGSGVIWDEEGRIVTNAHVVSDSEVVEVVLQSGERLEAEVVAADELSDLAVLEVDREGLPAVAVAEALPERGELALAIGNPLGFENTITEGIVSGLHRSIPSGGQTPALVELIQTSAPISPGNSGGALVGGDGEVIGINVAFIPPQAGAVSLGFAIPATTASDVVEELLADGEVDHAFLGIQPAPVTPEAAEQLGAPEQGVLVQAVTEGSAAAEAGIEPADVIVALGDREVASPEDLFAALRAQEPGDTVAVAIVREGEESELEVTLDERPAEPAG